MTRQEQYQELECLERRIDTLCECKPIGGTCDYCYTINELKRQLCRDSRCRFDDCEGCDHYLM